jgi:uncharacterized protein
MSKKSPIDPPASGKEPPQGNSNAVPSDLLEILVCPMGHAELKLEDGSLLCTRCGPRFPIEDGIPIMLIEEATLPPGVARIEDLPCYAEVEAREKGRREDG